MFRFVSQIQNMDCLLTKYFTITLRYNARITTHLAEFNFKKYNKGSKKTFRMKYSVLNR